jgi:hypothetical protein
VTARDPACLHEELQQSRPGDDGQLASLSVDDRD